MLEVAQREKEGSELQDKGGVTHQGVPHLAAPQGATQAPGLGMNHCAEPCR